MRWVLKLFGQGGPEAPAATELKTAPDRPAVGIPIPDGADPALFQRAPRPPKRGRRRSPEEIAEDRAAELRHRLEQGRGLAALNRDRAAAAGCTEFVWRTARDGDVCEACAALADRRFRYDAPPPTGMPGTHQCSETEVCRCYAEPVIN